MRTDLIVAAAICLTAWLGGGVWLYRVETSILAALPAGWRAPSVTKDLAAGQDRSRTGETLRTLTWFAGLVAFFALARELEVSFGVAVGAGVVAAGLAAGSDLRKRQALTRRVAQTHGLSPPALGSSIGRQYRVANVLTWIGCVSSAGALGWLLTGVLS